MENNFTPVPFWFWNDDLDCKEIERQMLEMKAKGVDGFVIHPRKVLPRTIEYMGEEYLNFVEFTVKKAKEFGMIVVLYDEAMYPSGSAHGMVVKENPEFASKGLRQIKKYGKLSYEMVQSMGTIRGVHEGEDDGEPQAPRSCDLLNPKAVESFIVHTHDKYYEKLKPYFGSTIKAIFTDEPCILGRNPISGLIPWTEGLLEKLKAYGFEETWLQYLFLDDGSEDARKANRIYKKVLHDLMAESYYGKLRGWCDDHGIGLMGHPEKSTDIGFMKYFTYPCQDIVWRFVAPENEKYIKGPHSCMGKCSSDAARHRNIYRNGNECFGVCSRPETPFEFTENDMRWYLNWLFVRGVNLIIPHAFYYSIRDGRGNERPPEVGMHNSFWPEYGKMSDYIKKMCSLLTGAVNQAKIAVLCSYDTMSDIIARPFFENQIEFNYLEEELLSQCQIADGEVKIAKQSYKAIVYDEAFENEMSEDTLRYLNIMEQAGVRVIKYQGNKALLEEIQDLREIQTGSDEEACNLKNIRTTHLVKEKAEYLILTNEGLGIEEFSISVKGKKIKALEEPYEKIISEYKKAVKQIKLKIAPYESTIIYLTK